LFLSIAMIETGNRFGNTGKEASFKVDQLIDILNSKLKYIESGQRNMGMRDQKENPLFKLLLA
jgi:hypothetical protein